VAVLADMRAMQVTVSVPKTAKLIRAMDQRLELPLLICNYCNTTIM